jgi:GDP-4-dehydro-6-deoxy-D-mannose reductase
MRALITGITGFAGSHLAEYLLSRDFEVFGTIRWRSKTENIDHIKDRLSS